MERAQTTLLVILIILVVLLGGFFIFQASKPSIVGNIAKENQRIVSINIVDIEFQNTPEQIKHDCSYVRRDSVREPAEVKVNINIDNYQNSVDCKNYILYQDSYDYESIESNHFQIGYNGMNNFRIGVDSTKSFFLKVCCISGADWSEENKICSSSFSQNNLCSKEKECIYYVNRNRVIEGSCEDKMDCVNRAQIVADKHGVSTNSLSVLECS